MNTPSAEPRQFYSKSSGFYFDTKATFFSDNAHLLCRAHEKNDLYIHQPRRTHCKLCSSPLSSESDFTSHAVGYSFCDICGHLNGLHEDTTSFAHALYSEDDGADYSLSYVDPNYLSRVENIYYPKAAFLLDNISLDPLTLLDVGCGGGHFIFATRRLGILSEGIDVGHVLVEYGNMHLQSEYGRTFLSRCDSQLIPDLIRDSSVDVISALAVIEHMTNPADFFSAFRDSSANYIFYSVPLYSFSAIAENLFPDVFPRHLSGGHTHLFTEQSLVVLNRFLGVRPLATC
jgi:hypothetical protein